MQPMHATGSCPACGRPRHDGDECPGCGLIYARWRPRPAPPQDEVRVHLPLLRQERLFVGLAEALDAGLPPLAFVEAAGAALPQRLLAALRDDQIAGRPLSVTFARLGILAGADLAFLQAGELQGGLPATLRLLAVRARDRRRERGRLLLALAYPLLLGLAGVVIVPLPLIVRAGFGAYALVVGPALAFAGLAALAALVLFPRLGPDAGPRRLLRRVGLVLPATSHALRNGGVATFLEVIGRCVAAGLPVRQALPLAQASVPLPAFRGDEPVRRLDAGRTLAEAVAAVSIVPPATLARIAQAEQVGALDRALPALAEEHRQRARMATLVAVVAVGLLAALAVAGALAWSVVEAWLAYFRQVGQLP